MDAENITVLETQSFVSDVREALKKLREKDVRIILGNFNEYWARKVFCEAYRLEMYGRSYQWLIMGTYSRNWWNSTYDTECSPDDLQKALDATILTDLLPLSTTGDITVSGIVSELLHYNAIFYDEKYKFIAYFRLPTNIWPNTIAEGATNTLDSTDT